MPELTRLPAAFAAGDTLVMRITLADYPASAGWVLSIVLINSAAKITLPAGVAAGADHLVTVPASTSAAYTAGAYSYTSAVTLGALRYTVGTGGISVLPNLAALTTFDNRSPARQALDDVNAALRSYGAKAWQQAYAIGERSQTFRSPEEFLKFRSQLESEVAREAAADALSKGLQPKNKLFVRFGAAR